MAVHERTGTPPRHSMELTENPAWMAGVPDTMADDIDDDAAAVRGPGRGDCGPDDVSPRPLRRAAIARVALARESVPSLRAAVELQVGRRSEGQSWC